MTPKRNITRSVSLLLVPRAVGIGASRSKNWGRTRGPSPACGVRRRPPPRQARAMATNFIALSDCSGPAARSLPLGQAGILKKSRQEIDIFGELLSRPAVFFDFSVSRRAGPRRISMRSRIDEITCSLVDLSACSGSRNSPRPAASDVIPPLSPGKMLPSCAARDRRNNHVRSLCLPRSVTVVACAPLSPGSSAKVTREPTVKRENPSASTLLRWK
jgi:hypothetical protein